MMIVINMPSTKPWKNNRVTNRILFHDFAVVIYQDVSSSRLHSHGEWLSVHVGDEHKNFLFKMISVKHLRWTDYKEFVRIAY